MLEKRLSQLCDRDTLSKLFPPSAEGDGVFFCNDKTLGACFIGLPKPGGDEGTRDKLIGLLNIDFPADTVINYTYFSMPQIQGWTGVYRRARAASRYEPNSTFARDSFARRAGFIEDQAEKVHSAIDRSYAPPNDAILILSIKCPLQNQTSEGPPDREELQRFQDTIEKCSENLNTAGFNFERLIGETYLPQVRLFFDPFTKIDDSYNEDIELREQILGPTSVVDSTEKSWITVNDDVHVKVMSIKRLPKRMALSNMNYLVGDPGGVTSQFQLPFFVSTTIYLPDSSSLRGSIMKKYQTVNYQAFGPMVKFIPKLGLRKEGFDIMVKELDQGGKSCMMSMTVGLYGKDKTQVSRMAGMVSGFYQTFDIKMAEESRLHLPVFYNALPLMASAESIKGTRRFWTMGVKHAVNFKPIFGDWRGTGLGGAHLLQTRRGQPLLFDFWDSPTNYNWVLTAGAGAGKSFAAQGIVQDLLSMGVKVWLFDNGYSYMKLAKLNKGEFISVRADDKYCFNPFSLIHDLADEMEQLKTIVAAMASPNTGLTDDEMTFVGEAIKGQFDRFGTTMQIDHVAEYLNKQDHPVAQMLGRRLQPYTSNGEYSALFNGENNLDLSNDFIVLELIELANRPVLQRIILMLLMQRINYEAFRGDKKRKKQIVLEEASEFLKNDASGSLGAFMAECARRIRKEEGGTGVVTQDIDDLYASASGRAIVKNSAWKLIMRQEPESIAALKDKRQIILDDYGYDLMRSVHSIPGKYSEIMVIGPKELGYGVARFVTDKFTQAAYSTKGRARTDIMEDIERGRDPVEAIEAFLASETKETNLATLAS